MAALKLAYDRRKYMVKIDVKMKAEYIYDLLLFHTYSKFSGFMVNVLGLAIIIIGGLSLGMGKMNMFQSVICIMAGIGFIAYTPLNLKLKAKQLMKLDRYSNDISYEFSENGIAENTSGNIINYEWSRVEKAIATPKDIAFYVGNDEALILPKEDFKENFMPVMKMIVQNVTRDKIYIR